MNKRYTTLLKRLVKHTKTGTLEWKDTRISTTDKTPRYRVQISPKLILEAGLTDDSPEIKIMYNYETIDKHASPGATDLWEAIKAIKTDEALEDAFNEIDDALDAIEPPKKKRA